jgi:hypothetical protein
LRLVVIELRVARVIKQRLVYRFPHIGR